MRPPHPQYTTKTSGSLADFDDDGLADACDDDTFIDSNDTDPLDPMRCQDTEDDGCDDCVSGDFAPFDDGSNADGDHLCDEGDPDDDNDGCEDGIDPFPFDPSVDDDLDFVGADCDNCPDDFNLGQVDYDQDGLGDVCDPDPDAGARSLALMAIGVLGLLRARYAVTSRAALSVGASVAHLEGLPVAGRPA